LRKTARGTSSGGILPPNPSLSGPSPGTQEPWYKSHERTSQRELAKLRSQICVGILHQDLMRILCICAHRACWHIVQSRSSPHFDNQEHLRLGQLHFGRVGNSGDATCRNVQTCPRSPPLLSCIIQLCENTKELSDCDDGPQ